MIDGEPRQPTLFRVRWERVDDRLLEVALKKSHIGTLREAEARPNMSGASLKEILGDAHNGPVEGLGPKGALFWHLVYALFTGGNGLVEHPAGVSAKSVLFCQVKRTVPDHFAERAYLKVWSGSLNEPLLVSFPQVPEILLDARPSASFDETCTAYRSLVAEIVDRVNLVWPAVATLARQN